MSYDIKVKRILDGASLRLCLERCAAMVTIDMLLTGAVAPLGPRQAPSGIAKTAVAGPVRLHRDGLAGDAQGDRKHHGGPEKAVHHYPFDHYSGWRRDIGARDILDRPGAFGENVSTFGIDETVVAVGDIYRAGTALLQVSQGRQPCWKLNHRFDVPDMALRVQQSGRTGWYYRVLEDGVIARGDELRLIDRPSPDWTIDRLRRVFYVDLLDIGSLAAIAELPHLAEAWRNHARRRLNSRQVADWTIRLTGEAPPTPLAAQTRND